MRMRQLEGHTVYHFPGCAYCNRVRSALKDLGLQTRWANINHDAGERNRLHEATGRTTVPVLRIDNKSGQARWIPESADIVHHLYEHYGEGRKPPLRVWITPAHVVLAIAVILFALSQFL